MKNIEEFSTDKILDKEIVRQNLLLSSLFLSAYEIIKLAIVDGVRDFFVVGFDQNGDILSENYKKSVLSLDKDKFLASCLWLERLEAITNNDVKYIRKMRFHRNQIAHELPRLLLDSKLNVDIELLIRLREVLGKIDIFWAKIELETGGVENEGIQYDAIQSGRTLVLDHIISVVLSEFEDDKE